MKRLIVLLRRSPSERWLLFRTMILLVLIRLGLWIAPFRFIVRGVNRLRRMPLAGQNAAIPPERIAWAVQTTSRCVPRATCLTQALTAHVLLGTYGWDDHLSIGVAKGADGRLQAHAWIEHDGRILVGDMPGLARFVPLPSLKMPWR
jgi:hypothetical protein